MTPFYSEADDLKVHQETTGKKMFSTIDELEDENSISVVSNY